LKAAQLGSYQLQTQQRVRRLQAQLQVHDHCQICCGEAVGSLLPLPYHMIGFPARDYFMYG
jgi:hypothetical protein